MSSRTTSFDAARKLTAWLNAEIGVAVGERQLRARREVVDDLEQRGALGAGASERTHRRLWRQALDIAVGLERFCR